MLSIVDLLLAKTLSHELAVVLLTLIRSGCSFLVGAVPGGAGKTTIMGALLNLTPPKLPLRPADSIITLRRALQEKQKACWICHEIGQGPYYAYLWGEPLRTYFQLLDHGHMLATNLHADTIEQAYEQICLENQVPAHLFYKIQIQLFLRVDGIPPYRRHIALFWLSDGQSPHRLVYELTKGWQIEPDQFVASTAIKTAEKILLRLVHSKARTIEQVRAQLLRDPDFSSFPICKVAWPENS